MKLLKNLRWNGEQEVHNASTHRDQQGIRVRETTRREDVGTVVSNDVDTAELIQSQHFPSISCFNYTDLLHEHDEESALSRTAVALDHEKLFPERLASTLSSFNLKQLGGVVHVASSLDVMGSESAG